jgi:hypothetical protein
MNALSLADFMQKRATLANRSLREKQELVRTIGVYFEEEVGTDIDSPFVLEAERFLNELYLDARNQQAPLELLEAIMEAVGLASHLSYAVKQNRLDKDYFIGTKKLGIVLIRISDSISSV